MVDQQSELNNGPAAAAILAAGIGGFFLGLITSLAEAIKAVENVLNFYNPVGPLTGKTWVAIALWLVAWAVLGSQWRNRTVDFGKVYKITLILIALGLLGTFPLFFNLL